MLLIGLLYKSRDSYTVVAGWVAADSAPLSPVLAGVDIPRPCHNVQSRGSPTPGTIRSLRIEPAASGSFNPHVAGQAMMAFPYVLYAFLAHVEVTKLI